MGVLEELAETLPTGAEFEQYLLESEQIGGTGGKFGPDALEAMSDFMAREQSYFDELKDLLQVYNYQRDVIGFADAIRLAHKMAVDFFGYDVYHWDRLSGL